MSYILDALKKSEETRGSLNADQLPPSIEQLSASGKRRIIMPLSVLLAALVVGWMVGQIQQSPETVVMQQNLEREVEGNATLPEASTPKQAKPEIEALPAPLSSTPSIQGLQQARRSETKPAESEKRPEIVPVTPATPVQRPEVKTNDQPADTAIEPLNELPVSLQQSLPTINIEGHIYDESPLARMVIINGKIRRELQTVGSGLTLQEITPDGVILVYRGTPFHMGIFGR